MTNKRLKVTGVVWGLLVLGALDGVAKAEDNPPVLKQTATIVEICGSSEPCKNSATTPHLHKGLAGGHLTPGQTFKVNRKFFRRFLRFVDLTWVPFDEVQRPDLYVIHGDKNPLSFDSIHIDSSCKTLSGAQCAHIDDFPLAFGIRLLENTDKSITPHAFAYIPYRLLANDPTKGDRFVLGILHIPDNDKDCDYPDDPNEKRHCLLTRHLLAIWSAPDFSHDKMKKAIETEYRLFLNNYFDDYQMNGAFIEPKVKTAISLSIDVGVWPSIKTKGLIDFLFTFFLHNDIIHGDLDLD